MNTTVGESVRPDTAVDPQIRLARAYLLRVAEPPAPALTAFVAEHGPLAAAAMVQAERCPSAVREETSARRRSVTPERDLAAAAECGARLVVPEDEEWPAWPLLCLEQAASRGRADLLPPLALWARGSARVDTATERGIAIVGARAATGYGEHIAADLAHGLAGRGVPVLSGAAYGIDGAAHRGAVAADGPTVAVLGCGLDIGYPAGHTGLLRRIAEHGVVLSEYPCGVPPARHRFLVRNRLIAALAEGVVVVEAGTRSGARNTAATAGALGKVVMAVPGPITSLVSVGCHELVQAAGASLVTSVEDVLEAVLRLGTEHGREAAGVRATDHLGAQAMRVYEALEIRNGQSADRVATESGVPLHRVRALLPALEIDGLARRDDTGWSRSRVARDTRGPTATEDPS